MTAGEGSTIATVAPYGDVHRERVRAHRKHRDKPGGSMEMKRADDPDWFPVLSEEVGEVARELNDYRHALISPADRMPRLRAELVQVAAMACAWIASIDKWNDPEAGEGCYICRPDDPAAAEEGCSACDERFWSNPVAMLVDVEGPA